MRPQKVRVKQKEMTSENHMLVTRRLQPKDFRKVGTSQSTPRALWRKVLASRVIFTRAMI